jgi:hypothetical protein
MPNQDPKYYTPKKIDQSKIPSSKLDVSIKQAYERVMTDNIIRSRITKKYKKYKEEQKILFDRREKEIDKAEIKAQQKMSYLKYADLQKINKKLSFQKINKLQGMETYINSELINAVNKMFPDYTQPTILGVWPLDPEAKWDELRPGQWIGIYGGGFGNNKNGANVKLNLGSYIIYLEILKWSDTEIRASISPHISDLYPNRNAKLWVEIPNLGESNSYEVYFKPLYTHWINYYDFEISGGMFGRSNNCVNNEGCRIANYFRVYTCEIYCWSYRGWAELRSPHAWGLNLEQGYHYGVKAFGSAHVGIYTHVIGPKGFFPGVANPPINGRWVQGGDLPIYDMWPSQSHYFSQPIETN